MANDGDGERWRRAMPAEARALADELERTDCRRTDRRYWAWVLRDLADQVQELRGKSWRTRTPPPPQKEPPVLPGSLWRLRTGMRELVVVLSVVEGLVTVGLLGGSEVNTPEVVSQLSLREEAEELRTATDLHRALCGPHPEPEDRAAEKTTDKTTDRTTTTHAASSPQEKGAEPAGGDPDEVGEPRCCPSCDGRGTTKYMKCYCQRCRGRGWLGRATDRPDRRKCDACDGLGLLLGKLCPYCGAYGRAPLPTR